MRCNISSWQPHDLWPPKLTNQYKRIAVKCLGPMSDRLAWLTGSLNQWDTWWRDTHRLLTGVMATAWCHGNRVVCHERWPLLHSGCVTALPAVNSTSLYSRVLLMWKDGTQTWVWVNYNTSKLLCHGPICGMWHRTFGEYVRLLALRQFFFLFSWGGGALRQHWIYHIYSTPLLLANITNHLIIQKNIDLDFWSVFLKYIPVR